MGFVVEDLEGGDFVLVGSGLFGLQNAESFAIDEEDVVGGAALGAEFADGDSAGGREVEGVEVLDSSARGAQLSVDLLAGNGFRR